MSDYPGDSDSKRVARMRVWFDAISEPANAVRGGPDPNDVDIMVLSGPEACDARCALALGADAERITCVDADADAIASARAALPGPNYVTGDVRQACWSARRALDVLCLDFCQQLTMKSVRYMAQCASYSLREGGLLIAAFSFGREGPTARSQVDRQRTVLSEMEPADVGLRDPYGVLPRGAVTDPRNAQTRYLTFLDYAKRAFTSFGCAFVIGTMCFDSVSYTSRTADRPGTPMLYVIGRITRKRSLGREKGIVRCNPTWLHCTVSPVDAPEQVREVAVTWARRSGSAVAANLLNLREPQVRAWLAVANRTNWQTPGERFMEAMAHEEANEGR
jgi:hypothetical protein